LNPSIELFSDFYHSFDNTLWILFIMRFNAVIAAYILAATVSSAALPVAEDTTTEVSALESSEEAPTEEIDYPLFHLDDEDTEVLKRDADAEAKYRPWGMPTGKRSADAEADAKYRPWGMPTGKRSADAEADAKYRPWGMPTGKRYADADAEAKYRPWGMPTGKRSADAEAEADADAKYRPWGMPTGKRSADADAEAKYRPWGMPTGKRSADAEARYGPWGHGWPA
jgi:mating pheromone alpha-factor